jgi:hypothetical protein
MEALEWQDVHLEPCGEYEDGYISFERIMPIVKKSKGRPTRKWNKIPLFKEARTALLALRSMGDVNTGLISTDPSAPVFSWPVRQWARRMKPMTASFYGEHGYEGRYFTIHKLRSFFIYYAEEVMKFSPKVVDGLAGNTSRTRSSNYDYSMGGWSQSYLPSVKEDRKSQWMKGDIQKGNFKTA